MLHVPCSRDMIGRVPARSTARPLAFMATSIEPWNAPMHSSACQGDERVGKRQPGTRRRTQAASLRPWPAAEPARQDAGEGHRQDGAPAAARSAKPRGVASRPVWTLIAGIREAHAPNMTPWTRNA